MYHWTEETEHSDAGAATHRWRQGISVGGHSAAVMDLAWDPQGSYLLSASDDQVGVGKGCNWR